MEHFEETDTMLTNRSPTGFTFEECPPDSRVSRQDVLVRQFEPFCNRRLDYPKNSTLWNGEQKARSRAAIGPYKSIKRVPGV